MNATWEKELVGKVKDWVRSAVLDGVCAENLENHLEIPGGFGYGAGCAWNETGTCRCPSLLDVCATEPRMVKLKEIAFVAQFSVEELGYCRTAAWVFFVPCALVLCLGALLTVLLVRRTCSPRSIVV